MKFMKRSNFHAEFFAVFEELTSNKMVCLSFVLINVTKFILYLIKGSVLRSTSLMCKKKKALCRRLGVVD